MLYKMASKPIYFEVNKELPLDPLIDFRENITKVSNSDQLNKALKILVHLSKY